MNAQHYGVSCRKLKGLGVMLAGIMEEVKATK